MAGALVAAASQVKLADIITSEVIFAARGMDRSRSQSTIYGPSNAWPVSQSWRPAEDRAKHASANSKNGVVGSSGKNAPTSPKATKMNPRTRKICWRAVNRPDNIVVSRDGGWPC